MRPRWEVRTVRIEEEIERIKPEAFFDYLRDNLDAADSVIGDLMAALRSLIINATDEDGAKADALISYGALREALVVAASHMRDLMYVDHDTSKLANLLLYVIKGLLVLNRNFKIMSLREVDIALGDLTLEVSIFIGDTVRHYIEKAKALQEAQVATAQGNNA